MTVKMLKTAQYFEMVSPKYCDVFNMVHVCNFKFVDVFTSMYQENALELFVFMKVIRVEFHCTDLFILVWVQTNWI